MTLTVLNDLHIGAVRTGGTTPQSAFALRRYISASFESLLEQTEGDLMILGDLFDTYSVPYMDLLACYMALDSWCATHPDSELFLVAGNHDLSKTVSTMSSFQFLCKLLTLDSNRQNIVVIDEPKMIAHGYVIPHLPNQDLFNLALQEVPPCTNLFLHCNYDNCFAVEADHSLNISPEQASAAPVQRIVIAHEHQQRVMLRGKVILPGNQIPSSVADCIGNDQKMFLVLNGADYELVPCWQAEGSFARIQWSEWKESPPDAQFIRVEGEASAVEASKSIAAISKLRSVHNAFVVTNAVKIEGRQLDGERLSLEKVKSFNILQALMSKLSPKHAAKVQKLLEEHGTPGD